VKRKCFVLVLLGLIAGISMICGLSTVFAQSQGGMKKIVIIRYKLPPDDFQDTVKNFKIEMTNNGFIEGKNVQYVDLLTSTGDQSSTPEVEAWVDQHKDSADAFVTCGWVGMVVRNKIKGSRIPQVCTFVFQPVAVKLMGGPLDKPSGSNVTTIYLTYPPDKILQLLKAAKPSATKYGVVWHSKVPADQFFKKWYEELAPDQRQGVEFVYFDLAEGLQKVQAEIKSAGLDAFGGGLGIRRPEFAPLLKMGIPVIGPKIDYLNIDTVRATDELMGYYNPFNMCGIQAATILTDVLHGKNIGEIAPQGVEKQVVYVNLNAAKRFGITVPLKLLEGGTIIIN